MDDGKVRFRWKKLWGERRRTQHHRRWMKLRDEPLTHVDELSRCLAAFDQNTSLTVVVEMSEGRAGWCAGMVPGDDRQPLKKLDPDPDELLRLLERWRAEAVKTGRTIERIVLAYEAGRDGFWLARWLQARGIEVHVIHSTSVAVSREHRRAKTDRLDTAMLKRVFLGWLRGERGHCGMVAIPTIEEEDAKRPSRERESLVGERTRIINRMKSTLAPARHPRLQAATAQGTTAACSVVPRRRAARSRRRTPSTRSRHRDMARFALDGPGDRSRRSSKRGWNVWKRRRQRGRMRSGAPAGARHRRRRRDQRTCWCERCCLGNCATDGPWRAMLA